MAKKKALSLIQVIPHDHFGDSPVLLTIPQMQKPFDYGWQREIVYRHIGSGHNSDVLYIAPCGKKLSSRLEVEKYLRTEQISFLSPDWFSFDSHVLVGGGEKEISLVTSVPLAQEPWRKSKWSTVVICTRYCPDRNNVRPSLQCSICKSFFHPECVFLSPAEAKKIKDSYTCTYCLLEENPGALKVKIKLTDVCPILKLSFDCLLHILSYLPVVDLCSASSVCIMWNQVSSQPSLWRRVSFRGVHVTKWDTAVQLMVQFSTQRLDLRGLVHGRNLADSWAVIANVLRQLSGLKWLDFGLVPAWIIHQVADCSPDLEVLTAEWISDVDTEPELWTHTAHLDFGKLGQLGALKRLHLRAACAGLTLPSFTFSGGLTALGSLTELTKLSLTTLKNIPASDFSFLRSLSTVEELEIGDCLDWDGEIYEGLGELKNLKCLRLECGNTHDGLPRALNSMHRLVHLELIMFGIPETLADILQRLPNLQSLAVWPIEEGDSNGHCLQAVCRLSDLRCLDWGIVTSRGNPAAVDWRLDDSLVVPMAPHLCSHLTPGTTLDKDANGNPVMSLNQLRRILCKSLPMTDVRVFKVPTTAAGRF